MDILKQIGLMLAKVIVKAFDLFLNPAAQLTAVAGAKLDSQLSAIRSSASVAKAAAKVSAATEPKAK